MDRPDALTGVFYATQFDKNLLGSIDRLVMLVAHGVLGRSTADEVAAAIDRLLGSGASIASRDVFAEERRSEEELREFLIELRRRLRSQ